MFKKLKKIISTKKVATSYVAIGFFILSAIIFLITKNEIISDQKTEVNLLNQLRIHSQALEYNLRLCSPTQTRQKEISNNLDSVLISYNHYASRQEYLRNETPHERSHKDQIVFYTDDLVKELKPNVEELIYHQILKDTTLAGTYSAIPKDSSSVSFGAIRAKTQPEFRPQFKANLSKSIVLSEKIKNQASYLYNWHRHELQNKIDLFERITVIVASVLFLILSIAYFILKKIHLLPLSEFNRHSGALLNGNYKPFKGKISREFKTIAKTVNSLIGEINLTAEILKDFDIKKIESKKSEYQEFLEQNHPLPNSLNKMFENFASIANSENQRNWTVQGQAKFSSLLNRNISKLEEVLDQVLPELVSYIDALQGAIFILPDAETSQRKDDAIMQLSALYAYDRKKYRKKKLEKGEGLGGQVWQEGIPMVINDLPEEHASIKSGLGEKQPTALVISPIIENGITYGILEIASFTKFEEYKIDFISKIVELLANTIASFEINQKTKNLLIESQTLAKQMQDKDSEMNEHLRALQTTKEEMEKRELLKENELKALRTQIDQHKNVANQLEAEHQSKLEKIKAELSENAQDNTKIIELEEELEKLKAQHDQEVLDLKETLKIKDMRIDKLRKKLQAKS